MASAGRYYGTSRHPTSVSEMCSSNSGAPPLDIQYPFAKGLLWVRSYLLRAHISSLWTRVNHPLGLTLRTRTLCRCQASRSPQDPLLPSKLPQSSFLLSASLQPFGSNNQPKLHYTYNWVWSSTLQCSDNISLTLLFQPSLHLSALSLVPWPAQGTQ